MLNVRKDLRRGGIIKSNVDVANFDRISNSQQALPNLWREQPLTFHVAVDHLIIHLLSTLLHTLGSIHGLGGQPEHSLVVWGWVPSKSLRGDMQNDHFQLVIATPSTMVAPSFAFTASPFNSTAPNKWQFTPL